MEHTLREVRIIVVPMGALLTASEGNRQRVLALLLAEREQMGTSNWALPDGPVEVVSRIPIGLSPIRHYSVADRNLWTAGDCRR